MVQPSTRIHICLILVVVVTGCLGGPGLFENSDTTDPAENPTEGPDDPDAVCVRADTPGDPTYNKCLVSERPPNIKYLNAHDEPHNLSISIVRNSTEEVFADAARLEAPKYADYTAGVWRDVLDQPGEYTITATMDHSITKTTEWSVGNRYVGKVEIDWRIVVHEDGELRIHRHAFQ
jgi:hypothetical protein